MIDVKELRVGNLVLGYYAYDENDQEQEITSVCRVLSIDSVGAHEYPLWVESIGKSNDVEEYDGFVAIPLTEEWLLRLGSGLIESGYDEGDVCIYEYSRFRLIWKPVYNYWYVVESTSGEYLTKIEFVHEWQNFVFAMDGEELEPTSAPEQQPQQ